MIPLAQHGPQVMAVGVDLKPSLCFTEGDTAWLAELPGPLADPARFAVAETELSRIATADAVACDLHPDLHATRMAGVAAERLGVPLVPVQHHHAHVAAVMAEHGITGPVIGMALDGFGFGSDGTAWGGELLHIDGGNAVRCASLLPVAMPGGDAAAREPWRMALGWLGDATPARQLFGDEPMFDAVARLCTGASAPRTSSAGRLFDAASAIVTGMRRQPSEGAAAMALEAMAADAAAEGPLLPFAIDAQAGLPRLDMRPALQALAEAKLHGEALPRLARRFHETLIAALAALAADVGRANGTNRVVLAGGCFANRLLAEGLAGRLRQQGFDTCRSERLPKGDGAIALGQAWVARHRMEG